MGKLSGYIIKTTPACQLILPVISLHSASQHANVVIGLAEPAQVDLGKIGQQAMLHMAGDVIFRLFERPHAGNRVDAVQIELISITAITIWTES